MSQPPQRHLFVIGPVRSGTSLLYTFLNLHPQIRLLYEADLLSNGLTDVSASLRYPWWERLDFYNSCISRHKLKPDASWSKVRNSHEAADILYRQFAGTQVRYIGEKSPTYYFRIPWLAQQFPNARFIVIWREPLGIITSILRTGKRDSFFRSKSLPLRTLTGFERMQADTLRLRAGGTPIYDLAYEDLIENPESVLRSICDFLELSFDPEMLDLSKADFSMFPPGEHHEKAKSGRLKREKSSSSSLPAPVSLWINRYRSHWQKRFGDQLSTRRYWIETNEHPFSQKKIWWDRVHSAISRFYAEQFVPGVYGLLPLSVLATYRQLSRSSRYSLPTGDNTALAQVTKISVITPSYKQLPWLKLCLASVSDQEGVEVEHIVQDAQSGPELEAWVRQNSKAQLYVESDSGMYDAINRGFARATGDIVCWLNSDEQYLEGTLAKVAHYFETHPKVDVLFGDAVLMANNGALLSYRRTVMPNMGHIQLSHLNILSCATFVRRSVIDRGYLLDTRWKTIADAVWVTTLLKNKVPMGLLNEPLAAFTITDKNLGQSSLALTEAVRWQKEIPYPARLLRLGYVLQHRLIKLLHGAYWPRSINTRFYTLSSVDKRVPRESIHVGFRWPEKA